MTTSSVADHIHEAPQLSAIGTDVAGGQLKRKTTRGVLISTVSQVATFMLRTGSLLVLARLLLKFDFGLVNMATAFIGFFGLARDGLSMATVQRSHVTPAQTSNLFWINLSVGLALAVGTTLVAPALAAFYGEPRLVWVVVALATILVFNSAAAQHRAILQRNMRFAALAGIDVASFVLSVSIGIGMALGGFGYWSLVAMMVSQPAAAATGVCVMSGWVPELPRRRTGVRSMVAYGGAISLNTFIAYVAYNADKVLVGRFWGADVLGMYGRAYQLINLPNENLNTTIGLVAFPALSRLHDDPPKFARYFRKGYSIFLSLVTPVLFACALFADDIILVAFGPKWVDATRTFRLLVPAIWGLSMSNPFAWLMLARGLASRCIKIALSVAPVVIVSYALGVRSGPEGVAAAFSVAMILIIIPVMYWARYGTEITMLDILRSAIPAAVSIVIATAAILAAGTTIGRLRPGLVRLTLESALFFSAYGFSLLFVMNEKRTYTGLLRELGIPVPLSGTSTAKA